MSIRFQSQKVANHGLRTLAVAEDAVGRDVAGAADERRSRVGSSAARVQTADGQPVREPVRKSEAVVDVVDVAVPDPEIFFDLLWMQGHPIDHQFGRAGSKPVADG